jgi:pimeloyl-ACP methyl ester carboxylesterase
VHPHPERVERACLAAAAGISITNLRRRPVLTGRSNCRRARRRVGGTEPLHRRQAAAALGFHELRLPPSVAHRAGSHVRAGARRRQAGLVDALDALTSYDFRDRLPDIKAPTLIVWGEHDMLVPVEDAHEFER